MRASTAISNAERHRAFTLIELLVVIVIIAILVGLALPAIGGARRAARSAVSLANLRACAQIQHAYAADYRGSFVNPFDSNNANTLGINWFEVLSQRPGGPWIWGFGNQGFCTHMFAPCWASLASQYLTGDQLLSGMLLSPDDRAARSRFAEMLPQVQASGNLDGRLWDTSYWSPPTLWLSTEPYKTAARVPIYRNVSGGSRYWRRNRLDDATSPDAKVMVFERFDFSRKDRSHKAGGREAYAPMFNNPEATTRFALVDGSVSSVKMSKLYRITDAVSSPQGQVDTFSPSGDFEIPDADLGDPNIAVFSFQLGKDSLENGDGTMLGVPGGLNKYPAFFWATRHGIQGRDIPR